jgi:hypothetical protein
MIFCCTELKTSNRNEVNYDLELLEDVETDHKLPGTPVIGISTGTNFDAYARIF